MKLSEKIQEALREQQEINLSDPAVQKRLAAQWGYVPAGAQPKKVHAVVCFYGLHYYVSALFFDPTSAIARCRKEVNNSAYPDSWKVVEFEVEDTLDSAQPAPSITEGVRKVTRGFRWESEAQHHIPTIEIEFEPVSPDSPNDARGWQDRDRLAAMLSPEAKP